MPIDLVCDLKNPPIGKNSLNFPYLLQNYGIKFIFVNLLSICEISIFI